MAAKPVKAPKTSLTKRATFRRVSPKIASAFTPVQSNAARLRATNALNRAKYRTNRSLARSPHPNHSLFFGMYAAQQRMQARYRLNNTKLTAMKHSTRQNQQLAAGNFARKQAALRSGRQQMRVMALYGIQKSMRSLVTKAAGATPAPLAVARVSARTRNTSAAARAAQSRRAQVANTARLGRTYKKGGGSSGSGRTSAPAIRSSSQSRSRTRTRTSAPMRAVKTPKAARPFNYAPREFEGEAMNPWIVAGNDRGADNCAAVAIANHLWYHHSLRMTDEQVTDLATHGKTINGMLGYLKHHEALDNARPERWQNPLVDIRPGDLVVYRVGRCTHASLILSGNLVVSWGEEVPINLTTVLEGWRIQWRTYRRSAPL